MRNSNQASNLKTLENQTSKLDIKSPFYQHLGCILDWGFVKFFHIMCFMLYLFILQAIKEEGEEEGCKHFKETLQQRRKDLHNTLTRLEGVKEEIATTRMKVKTSIPMQIMIRVRDSKHYTTLVQERDTMTSSIATTRRMMSLGGEFHQQTWKINHQGQEQSTTHL